ncbi:hypothetical protein K443DRAFT_9676 [Laccaria amethystina LaAM-08-1]|uniref:Unplaced genomic scaffold K443scaffold_150, whole genome shotgun sequence n=1 Tax=Laccaria amethystina LaAM-08-1 TaxID=1095629 RepID=A0A0C9X8I3_9AGAR|nr:hypothetical protein K443DRAFT_9676 [Laccaria amethystina LaAM-08-1]
MPPRPPKKRRQPPTNEDNRPNDDECPQTNHHHPPWLTNDGQRPPTDRPRYEIRCPVVSKRRHGEYPCPTFVPTPLADNGSYVATTNDAHHERMTSSILYEWRQGPTTTTQEVRTPSSTNGNERPGLPAPDTNGDNHPAAPPPTNGDDRLHHHLMNGDKWPHHHHAVNGDKPPAPPHRR